MKMRIPSILLSLAILFVTPSPSPGYNWTIGEHVDIEFKGDFTIASRIRLEDPYPDHVELGGNYYCKGNAFYEKGDVTNVLLLTRIEGYVDVPNFTFFFRDDITYSPVVMHGPIDWTDEQKDHAGFNFTDSLEYYLEGRYSYLTARAGRFVVEWGESMMPVFAPSVNVVSPFFLQKVASPGYTVRDYQIPGYMLWINLEPLENLSYELILAPDFDTRFLFPVVGTFASPADLFGIGHIGNNAHLAPNDSERVEQFEYGGSARMVFPKLDNFELGLYYYHYHDRFPIATGCFAIGAFPVFPDGYTLGGKDVAGYMMAIEYPTVDMFGLSFSQAIQSIQDIDLNVQIGGELAYRPNKPMQLAMFPTGQVNSPMFNFMMGNDMMGGGYERCQTLTWDLNSMKMMFDIMPFTPWTFNLTAIAEVYGQINLEHKDHVPGLREDLPRVFNDPQFTSYYSVQLPMTVSDMVDNTTLTFTAVSMGTLHREQNNSHNLMFTLMAKYGNSWEAFVGYNLVTGTFKQSPGGGWDRDALTIYLRYYFI